MEKPPFYTVCTWDRTLPLGSHEWVGVADFDDEPTARQFAQLLVKGTRRSARVLNGWTLDAITQYGADGNGMTAAQIAKWDEPEEEELTEAEERERREEFIADQEYNISREQQ